MEQRTATIATEAPAPAAPAARAPRPDERRRVLEWLDAGLRRGEGRLAAEYPLALGDEAGGLQRVVFDEAGPAAHALLQGVEVRGRGRALRLGLIGSVYSDPARRGRGYAQACVRACLDAARAQGLPLVLLWSDLVDFYGRLGFLPAGRDVLLELDPSRLAALAPAPPRARVAPARVSDFAALETFYARKPVHVQRPPGALRRLAAAPDTSVVVARSEGTPLAYAALGRGDDFRGVVHEWAGDPEGVLACLAWLTRRHGTLHLLAGPEPEPPVPQLLAAGTACEARPLGLVRLLDARRLWEAIAPGASPVRFSQAGPGVALSIGGRSFGLPAETALELLFGSGPEGLADAIDPDSRAVLGATLPFPLYVWGFDSV